jgi:phenylacetate-CoA ligase
MVEAFHEDSKTWRAVNLSLRDAIVDFAAQHCAYYRKLIQPSQPFEAIPLLTKTLIREHADDLLAEGIPENRRVAKRTSGSAGQPLEFFRDSIQGPAEDISAQRFLKRLHGVPEPSTMVWAAAFPHTSTGVPDLDIHPLPVGTLSPERLRHEVLLWGRFRSYFLYGQASAIHWMADQVRERGLEVQRLPACVIATSDLLTEQAEQEIRDVFQCPVHSWYGSHEFNGFLAGTLPGTRRYAFNPLLCHVEVTDDAGQPVEPGNVGKLVVTDLNNHVFPFIRYDTEDLATRARDEFVGGWRVIDRIEGRSSELLRFPSGRILSGTTLGQFVLTKGDLGRFVRFYQCAQTGSNELELRIVWRGKPSNEVRSRVERALGSIADPDTAIRTRDVEKLETLPSGKAWIVRTEFER